MVTESVYLWILPMFHACGWTYPWAITLAFASQVSSYNTLNGRSECSRFVVQITLRTVSPKLIWNHLLNSGVTHYCGAPTVQIALVSAPEARKVPRPVTAIVAGSAPTAQLLGELEAKGINVVHVYGLT